MLCTASHSSSMLPSNFHRSSVRSRCGVIDTRSSATLESRPNTRICVMGPAMKACWAASRRRQSHLSTRRSARRRYRRPCPATRIVQIVAQCLAISSGSESKPIQGPMANPCSASLSGFRCSSIASRQVACSSATPSEVASSRSRYGRRDGVLSRSGTLILSLVAPSSATSPSSSGSRTNGSMIAPAQRGWRGPCNLSPTSRINDSSE